MGRPKELTDEERAALLSEGLNPVEVWLPDIWSDEVWEQVYQDCKLIRSFAETAENSFVDRQSTTGNNAFFR